MSKKHTGPVDRGTTYLAFGGTVSSGVAIRHQDKEPQAQVMWAVDGKWNRGASDNLDLMLTADLAEEIGNHFLEAAKAAREDLREYLITGDTSGAETRGLSNE